MRSAWFVEGAAQWLSGQTRHVRPAVARRLREGPSPSFPPARTDALLLGGTIFDLLDRHAGPAACAMLVARLRRDGPRSNLELAFEAPMSAIERAWREHLDEILYPQSEKLEASSLGEALELPTPPDLDLGSPPEFGFETGPNGRREKGRGSRERDSGGGLVEQPDQQRGERHRRDHADREAGRRADPRQ
jgi:hypothetical protein